MTLASKLIIGVTANNTKETLIDQKLMLVDRQLYALVILLKVQTGLTSCPV